MVPRYKDRSSNSSVKKVQFEIDKDKARKYGGKEEKSPQRRINVLGTERDDPLLLHLKEAGRRR